ncbi:MAG: dodecin domain-containing protein [Halioglobus sp.]|nr:dodecin domain-containing protein [Halioglobus sp.]
MQQHVYKSVEITGSSDKSVEEAVQAAISRASETLHNLRWFEVTDVRGQIDEGQVNYWQVTVKLGLTLD